MSPERAQPNDPITPPAETVEPPLEGVLTEEDIREIKASGITLSDVIRELEAKLGSDTKSS